MADLIEGGGRLLISGAEIGWDLVDLGTPADQTFYTQYLGAEYVADDAGAYCAEPIAGGLFVDLGAICFDDGDHGTYDVDWPDCMSALPGGRDELRYTGMSYVGAASFVAGTGRLVILGFPIETVYPEGIRTALVGRAMGFLLEDLCIDGDGDGYSPDGGGRAALSTVTTEPPR